MGTETVISTTAGKVLPSVTPGVEKEAIDATGNALGHKIIPFILENTAIKDSANNGILFTVKFEIIAKPAYGNTTSVVFADYDDTMFASLDYVLQPVFDEGSVTVLDEAPTTAAPTTIVNTTTTENPTTTENIATTVNNTTAKNTTIAEKATTTKNVNYKTNPVSDEGFALYNPDTDDDKLTVELDDVSGAVGDIVDFSAVIKNNSGLFSASISLKYDSDVLRPVMAISGQELIVDTVAGNVLPSVVSGPINEVTDEQNNKLGYQVMSFIFENAGMTDSTNNGILMTVKFEIIAKPAYGDTTSVVFTDYNDTLFASLDGVLQPVFDEGSVTVLDEATTTSAPTTLAPTTTVVPTTSVPTTTQSITAEIIYGDATGDGSIDMLDVLLIRKYIAKQPVKPNLTASEVTCDNSIDMLDVLLIRKYIAKQPVTLGPKN